MATWDDVRRLVAALPDTDEHASYGGLPSWRVHQRGSGGSARPVVLVRLGRILPEELVEDACQVLAPRRLLAERRTPAASDPLAQVGGRDPVAGEGFEPS